MVTDSLSGNARGGGTSRRPFLRYKDRFEEVFPFYLSIGMTPQQYWDDDCTLARAFREAHEIRLKRESETLWLQGAYIYEILLDVAPMYRAFKPSKPKPYRKEAIPVFEDKKALKKEKEKKQMEEDRAKFRGMVEAFNREFLKKQRGEDDGSADGRTQL